MVERKRKKTEEAFVGNQTVTSSAAARLKDVLEETFQMVKAMYDRIVIPDDFLPGHEDRETMIAYLKALSCKGTETGAAVAARISMRQLRKWQQIDEFVEMEQYAQQAYTDLLKEIANFQIIAGDKALLQTFLKARDPSFTERHELTGPKGGPMQFHISFEGMPRPKRLE